MIVTIIKVILYALGVIFLALICFAIIAMNYNYEILLNDEIVKYLQSIFYIGAMGTFIVAVSQFNYNTKWNKKQLTIQILNSLKDNLKVHFEFLHKTFKYRDIDEPISVETIHQAMGEFTSGISQSKKSKCSDEEKVNISGKEFVYHNDKKINGKDINNKIKNFLNDLEAFAAAVNDKTLDEKLSKNLMRGIVTRAYKYFEPYILHLRSDHREVSNLAYKELMTLGSKWSKKELHQVIIEKLRLNRPVFLDICKKVFKKH